jgi:hypothetical protein
MQISTSVGVVQYILVSLSSITGQCKIRSWPHCKTAAVRLDGAKGRFRVAGVENPVIRPLVVMKSAHAHDCLPSRPESIRVVAAHKQRTLA